MAKKKIKFPPSVTYGPKIQFIVDGTKGHMNPNGAPTLIPLQRLGVNDRTIRGDQIHECCDCKAVHSISYEVFCQKGKFYLQKRTYSIKDGKK